jgi:hypothetical protein
MRRFPLPLPWRRSGQALGSSRRRLNFAGLTHSGVGVCSTRYPITLFVPPGALPEDEILLKEETQRNAPNLTGSREPALGAAGEGDLKVMSGLLPVSRVTG